MLPPMRSDARLHAIIRLKGFDMSILERELHTRFPQLVEKTVRWLLGRDTDKKVPFGASGVAAYQLHQELAEAARVVWARHMNLAVIEAYKLGSARPYEQAVFDCGFSDPQELAARVWDQLQERAMRDPRVSNHFFNTFRLRGRR